MTNQKVLIIGASSTIAKALVQAYKIMGNVKVVLVSREPEVIPIRDVVYIQINDYLENTIVAAIEKIKIVDNTPFTRVFICNGLLHSDSVKPEKRIEDISAIGFQNTIWVNTVVPMIWIQKLTPILTSKIECKLVVFSARVGSIKDNKLGGWYSYRASKAALNMLLKTTAIEFARRAKNIKIIAFHPGTTDTKLSKPFQKNVPKNKLFTPEFVAQSVISVTNNMPIDGTASYIDWQGESIEW
ncbi:SDR family NAD(P)-dependent oxidoreductase [Algibacillus agarilyticus]|uniref:SDR family NAD(P)-dependent oxidoreductase n=1 Tax=Algibacillus agarilyticus TaxID=2234133 RepID=UPI000DD02FCA|nr:SDR family NAD(P)-dependent oxidoreductase [Algibacillus agarilyticus]